MNKYQYMTPFYQKEMRRYKLLIDNETLEDIKIIETLSKGYEEEVKEAVKLDRVVSTELKKLCDKAASDIEAAEKSTRERMKKSEEEEERKKEDARKRQEAAQEIGLPHNATWEAITEARQTREKLDKRAKKVGLQTGSTIKQIEDAEAEHEKKRMDEAEKVGKLKQYMSKRAQRIGLPEDATLEEIEEAETKQAEAETKKTQEKESVKNTKTPKNKNYEVLKKLHHAGTAEVTREQLSKEGFNTGFFGPLSSTGCKIGEFVLTKKSFDTKYKLFISTKK